MPAPPTSPEISPNATFIAALDGADTDTALERAMSRMGDAADLPLLMAICRALLRAGHAGLAHRLLCSMGGPSAAHPDLRALHDQVARLPSGEMPLASGSNRYAANLAALSEILPDVAEVVAAAAADLDDLHVFVTAQGNVQVVRGEPAGGLLFAMPYGNHHRLAREVDLGDAADRGAFMLAGVPSAPLLARLEERRFSDGFRPSIDVIETDARMLALWLHLVRVDGLIAQGRLAVFGGPDALEQYAAYRETHLWRADPTRVIAYGRPGWQPPEALAAHARDTVPARVRARHQALMERQARHYDGRSPDWWARRYARAGREEPALRVLGITTRYSTVIQHAMRDLAGAFRRHGCAFDLLKEPNDSAAIVDTWSTLTGKPFDLVVVINHLRRELRDHIDANVPFVCWMQDHLPALWCREAGRSVGPLDLVVSAARCGLVSNFEYPAERVLPSSNLTDLATYSNEPAPPDEVRRHACDVSFVSHGSETPEQLVGAVADREGADVGAYFARIVELLRARLVRGEWLFLVDALEIMERAERECGLSLPTAVRRDHAYPMLLRLFDRLVRHETMHWAARWADAGSRTLRIYGRGWETHPVLSRFACGEIGNGEPLRCVYQASRVNIQVTGYASLHQRLLDALASGGMVLTRYNPSDFARPSALRIAEYIERQSITDYAALLEAVARSSELAALFEEQRARGRPADAPADDPRRQRDAHLFREYQGAPAERLTDESYFETLRDASNIPHRAAGDLPGFEGTTFRDEASFHALLDRYVDDVPARRRMCDPMREAVATHDTFDALVARLIDSMRRSLAAS